MWPFEICIFMGYLLLKMWANFVDKSIYFFNPIVLTYNNIIVTIHYIRIRISFFFFNSNTWYLKPFPDIVLATYIRNLELVLYSHDKPNRPICVGSLNLKIVFFPFNSVAFVYISNILSIPTKYFLRTWRLPHSWYCHFTSVNARVYMT